MSEPAAGSADFAVGSVAFVVPVVGGEASLRRQPCCETEEHHRSFL